MERKRVYKYLIIIPVLMFGISLLILVNGYIQTGEWFKKSIELKGGVLISFSPPENFDLSEFESQLKKIGEFSLREIKGLSGNRVMIEMDSKIDKEKVMELLESFKVKDVSFESIGPSLGKSFWKQAQIGIILAFIFMGIIVFVIFRTFIPSLAVILAAVSDILCTLAFMQVLGISLTLAGLAALLMLIGYSIDTDILLTTRVLKTGEMSAEKRVKTAFKTGITMTATTLAALISLYISSLSPVLSQIAIILIIGLLVDIINTWLQNAGILEWYCEKKGL